MGLAAIHVGVGGREDHPVRTGIANSFANAGGVAQVGVLGRQGGEQVVDRVGAQLANEFLAQESGGTE